MLTGRGKKSLFVTLLIIGAMITFGLGVLSAKVFLMRDRTSNKNVNVGGNADSTLLTEGFDFKPFRASGNEWRGPDVGEKIALSSLTTKDGKTLASLIGQRPAMIVSVNPDCPMCVTARDEMIHLRNKLAAMKIDYFLVCFAPQASQSDFFKYSDSLNVGAPSFLWNAEAGNPPNSLFTMTNPTHLLLNSDGTVLRVWPGSYKDVSVRQRMASQIIADTTVAIDTFNALLPKTAGDH